MDDVTSRTAVREAAAVQRPYRRALLVPHWWGDAAGVLAWLSMLIVVALWVAGGGLKDLAAPLGEGGLDSAGRLTGLISADLLLIQVLLMARVPFIERAFGQDE